MKNVYWIIFVISILNVYFACIDQNIHAVLGWVVASLLAFSLSVLVRNICKK